MLVTTAMANLDRMPVTANATDAGDLAARTPNSRRRLGNLDDATAKPRDRPHVASQQVAAHDKLATVVGNAHVFAKQYSLSSSSTYEGDWRSALADCCALCPRGADGRRTTKEPPVVMYAIIAHTSLWLRLVSNTELGTRELTDGIGDVAPSMWCATWMVLTEGQSPPKYFQKCDEMDANN